MAEWRVNMKVQGLRELEQLMARELPAKVARKTMLKAMKKAIKPTEEAIQREAPKKSHSLVAATGSITVPLRGRDIMSGASGDTVAEIDTGVLSGNTGKALHAWAQYMSYYKRSWNALRKPGLRHQWLVEFGFTHRSGKKVPANPFMRRAWDQTARSYSSLFLAEMRKGVADAINKHNSKTSAKK